MDAADPATEASSPRDRPSLPRGGELQLWEPILTGISDGVIVCNATDPDHSIVWVNPAFERITGYPAAEAVGRNPRFLQGTDRAQPAIVQLRQALRQGEETEVVLRNYTKAGELFWNRMTLRPVAERNGETRWYLGIIHDVSLHREVERERRRNRSLKESEEMFRQIAEHLQDAVWLTTPGGDRLLYANSAFQRIWGPAPSPAGEGEDRDDPWWRSIHPQDRSAVRALTAPVEEPAGGARPESPGDGGTEVGGTEVGGTDGGGTDEKGVGEPEPAAVEFRLEGADGSRRILVGRSFPIRDETGHTVRRAGVATDVTGQRRAEEKLRRTNQALAGTVQELARRNLQMLALNETVDHLQTCSNRTEAEDSLAQCVPEIFPRESGGLYLTGDRRTALEALTVWGRTPPSETPFPPDHCEALRRGREFWTESSYPQARCRHGEKESGFRNLCIALRNQERILGLLHLRWPADGAEQEEEELKANVLRFAINVAEQIALGLSNIDLREHLQAQAIRDPLTGLYNRRFFDHALERELGRSRRRDLPVALLMIDLDRFKRINDRHGHDAGDRMLQAVARSLREQVRTEDVVARYGGEEFTILLPDTGLADAALLADRLRRSGKELEVPYGEGFLGPVSLSIGVAALPESGRSSKDLFQAADHALYRAKRRGRDRVETSPQLPAAGK